MNHPGHAELVGQHPELLREEGRPDRHRRLPARGKRGKGALGFDGIVDLQGDAKPLRLGEVRAGGVAAHQAAVADREPRVHDAVGIAGHARSARRRLAVAHHGHDLAVERAGVEGERGLALAIETEIGYEVGGHGLSPFAVAH